MWNNAAPRRSTAMRVWGAAVWVAVVLSCHTPARGDGETAGLAPSTPAVAGLVEELKSRVTRRTIKQVKRQARRIEDLQRDASTGREDALSLLDAAEARALFALGLVQELAPADDEALERTLARLALIHAQRLIAARMNGVADHGDVFSGRLAALRTRLGDTYGTVLMEDRSLNRTAGYFARAIWKEARALREKDDKPGAEALFRDAIGFLERLGFVGGKAHASLVNDLSRLLCGDRHAESIAFIKDLLDRQKRTLGNGHLALAYTYSVLGKAYLRAPKASIIFDDPPIVNLAYAYLAIGNLEAAEALLPELPPLYRDEIRRELSAKHLERGNRAGFEGVADGPATGSIERDGMLGERIDTAVDKGAFDEAAVLLARIKDAHQRGSRSLEVARKAAIAGRIDLARDLLENGRNVVASALADKVGKDSPDDDNLWGASLLDEARVHIVLGAFETALHRIEQASMFVDESALPGLSLTRRRLDILQRMAAAGRSDDVRAIMTYDDADTAHDLAELLIRRGLLDDARGLLESTKPKDRFDADSHRRVTADLAAALAQAGRRADAEAVVDRILGTLRSGDTTEAAKSFLIGLVERGLSDSVVQRLEQLPKSEKIWVLLALSESAIQRGRQADGRSFLSRAETLLAQGAYDESRDSANAAIAQRYVQLGDIATAEALVSSLGDRARQVDAWNDMALRLAKSGRGDPDRATAQAMARASEEQDPKARWFMYFSVSAYLIEIAKTTKHRTVQALIQELADRARANKVGTSSLGSTDLGGVSILFHLARVNLFWGDADAADRFIARAIDLIGTEEDRGKRGAALVSAVEKAVKLNRIEAANQAIAILKREASVKTCGNREALAAFEESLRIARRYPELREFDLSDLLDPYTDHLSEFGCLGRAVSLLEEFNQNYKDTLDPDYLQWDVDIGLVGLDLLRVLMAAERYDEAADFIIYRVQSLVRANPFALPDAAEYLEAAFADFEGAGPAAQDAALRMVRFLTKANGIELMLSARPGVDYATLDKETKLRRKTFRLHLDMLYSAWQKQPGQRNRLAEEAFKVAQWMRTSRAARDLIASTLRISGTGTVARGLSARKTLSTQLAEVYEQLNDLGDDAFDTAPFTDLAKHLATLLREDDGEPLDAGSLRLDLVSLSQPLSAAAIQEHLGASEALLLFLLEDDTSYVWLVRKDRVDMARVDTSAFLVAEAVSELREGLDPTSMGASGALPPFNMTLAHKLYRQLFAPVDTLLEDVEHLIVVPDGGLGSLPVGVLITDPPGDDLATMETYRHAPWLARRFAVSVMPSVAAFPTLRLLKQAESGRRPFIGIGDPVLRDHPGDGNTTRGASLSVWLAGAERLRGASDVVVTSAERTSRLQKLRQLPSLPETAQELRQLANSIDPKGTRLLLREAAAEDRVRGSGDLGGHRIIAFATHGLLTGELDGENEPALVLTPPSDVRADNDGLLTASEIGTMDLDADWVVLSACNTAGSSGEPGGEGLSGLARAFFAAGSRALLVSHWPVFSSSTVRLTTDTFSALAKDPTIGRAEALRRAQLSMISDPDNPAYAHPAVWAPFVVVGEGRRGR